MNVILQDEANVNLMVLFPTKLRENHAFTTKCQVTGNPAHKICLRHEDTGTEYFVGNQSETVTLSMLAKCDLSGRWTCTGYNKLNKLGNATMTRNITVFCEYEFNRLLETVM